MSASTPFVPLAPLLPPSPGTSQGDELVSTAYTSSTRGGSVLLSEPSPDATDVPEALVQDLWKRQQFDAVGLTTTQGAPVVVLDPGRHNTDAGPDFSNAHLRIGDVDWRGDVEIHTTSSTWFAHRHHTDPRYDRVVLHVTLHADVWTGALTRSDDSVLPEVVLYPRLQSSLRRLLHTFYTRPDPDTLPCATQWDAVPPEVKRDWIETLGIERICRKRDQLRSRRAASLADHLHERLFTGLGYAKNDTPMSMLAQRLPLDRVQALTDARDREALHFGVANLLPDPRDLLDADRLTADYVMMLHRRYDRLCVNRSVPRMDRTIWTFFRMRPTNFPPLRIAQAVAWFDDGGLLTEDPVARLRDAVRSDDAKTALRKLLRPALPDFWRTHYRLSTSTGERDPRLGRTRADTLIVNAVLPVLLLDAERREDEDEARALLDVARTLPPQDDRVVRRFRKLGTKARTALDAQGLHRLYRAYCTPGRCLHCTIGQHLLDQS